MIADGIDPEVVVDALYSYLVETLVVEFVGNADASSASISDITDTSALFEGLPVFGGGATPGAVIKCVDDAHSITLSLPLTAGGSGIEFSTGFRTKSRRAKYWTDVVSFPAIFVRHIADEDVWSGDGLQILCVEAEVWLYSKVGSADVPDIALNKLVRIVRRALTLRGVDGDLTFNDLIYRCRIEGRSEYDPGDLDNFGKAVVPVKMLVSP